MSFQSSPVKPVASAVVLRQRSTPLSAVRFAAWAIALLVTTCSWQAVRAATTPTTAKTRDVAKNFERAPLTFERNVGQTNSAFDFVARGRGYAVFVSHDGAFLRMVRPAEGTTTRRFTAPEAFKFQLLGSNARPAVEPLSPAPGSINYMVGPPQNWRAHVPGYTRVRYADVYRGIDLVYYGNQYRLEHDFVVRPGGNPAAIRFRIGDKLPTSIDEHGALLVTLKAGQIRWEKPQAYQEIAGQRRSVPSAYHISKTGEISFAVGKYDRRRPLIIDPVVIYSTYLGGSSIDTIFDNDGIAADGTGGVYVGGVTVSVNFPTTSGAYDTACGTDGTCNSGTDDLFITKFDGNGSVIFSTYIGGSGNDDQGLYGPGGLAADSSGVYIISSTDSTDFPVTAGAFRTTAYTGTGYNGAVAKLDSTGATLLYGSYFGGTADDEISDVRVDGSGNAYITGQTSSTDFPVTAGALQSTCAHTCAFVLAMNSSGTGLVYSTYLSGTTGYSYGTSITADSSGYAYVTGTTGASDFPTTAGAAQQTPLGGGVYVRSGSTWTQSVAGITDRYTPAVMIYPPNHTVLYAAGYELFQSTDSGATWAAYGSNYPYFNTQKLVANASGGLMLALGPGGAYSSADGGSTWTHALSTGANTCYDAVFDPFTQTTVYAACSNGVYKSTDGGSTWATANTGLTFARASAISVSNASSTVYVVTPNGLFVSTNSAASWSVVGATLPTSVSSAAVTPSNASRLYAIATSSSTTSLYTSTDGGGSWSAISTLPTTYGTPATVYVHPVSDQSLYVKTSTGALWFTSDACSSWSLASAGLGLGTTTLAIDDASPFNVYSGQSFAAAFAARFDPAGALVYSTFLGGTGTNRGWSIATDGNGNAYILGAASADFAVSGSAYQSSGPGGFVTKLNGSGAVLYSTFFPVTGWISVDSSANAWITGITSSPSLPLVNPLRSVINGTGCTGTTCSTDAVIAELNSTGSALLFSTYWGGEGTDYGLGITVDSLNNVFVTGSTSSLQFPTVNAFQNAFGGGSRNGDAWVLKLSSSAATVDLSVTPTFSATDAPAGGTISASFAVANHGSTSATHATLNISVPSGLTVSGLPGSCAQSGTSIRCDLGTLGANASTSVSFSIAATTIGSYTVTSGTGSDQSDSNPSDNSSSTAITVADSCPGPSAYVNWKGGTSSDWFDATNWGGGAVPSSSANVYVCASATNEPTLSASTSIGSLLLESGATLSLGSGVTLTASGSVTANGTISGGALSLSGTGTLQGTAPATSVSGNISLSGATSINGALTVYGTFTLNGNTATVAGSLSTLNGSGRLVMTNANDSLIVSGDALFQGANEDGSLTAGTLALAGNFTQSNNGAATNSFAASGSHRTRFLGSRQQTVSFTNPATDSSNSHFQDLEIANTGSGSVLFQTTVVANGNVLVTSGTVTGGVTAYIGGGLTDSAGNKWQITTTTFTGGNANISGQVQTNIVITSATHVQNDFTVNGNLTIAGSALYMDGHTITVNGDFATVNGAGLLVMQNGNDRLTVHGNVTFQGGNEDGALTTGVIELTGNFAQSNNGAATNSFAPWSTRTRFIGSSQQTVSFTNPAADSSNSHFGDLEIANTSAEGVVFQTTVYINGSVYVTDGAATGNVTSYIGGNLVDAAGNRWRVTTTTFTGGTPTIAAQVQSNIVVTSAMHVQNDFAISGNLTVASSLIYLDGHTVTVNGDFATANGAGALVMQNALDQLTVHGNVTFEGGNEDGALTAGVIELTGNFVQSNNGAATNSFAPWYTKTRFIGATQQTVSFTNPAGDSSNSHFADLEIANAGNGVLFTTTVYINGSVTMTSGIASGAITAVLAGNLTDAVGNRWQVTQTAITGGSPALDPMQTHMVISSGVTTSLPRGFTLTGELSVDGVLILAGQTVTVYGPFDTRNGAGVLRMINSSDVLNVVGDVLFQGGNEDGSLTSGTLQLTGNFTQSNNGAATNSFDPSGSHLTRFVGSSQQNIAFTNPASDSSNSHFQNLEIAGAGVNFASTAFVNGNVTMSSGGAVGSTGVSVYLSGNLTDTTGNRWQVPQTIILGGSVALDPVQTHLVINSGTTTTLQSSLTVTGELSVDGALVLNGHSATVNGPFETRNGSGWLRMLNTFDVLTVNGDATFQGSNEDGSLIAGVLQVAGNFAQTNNGAATNSFAASGTHTTRFSGSSAQTVSFTNPAPDSSNSHFENVEISNAAGVTFNQATYANGNLVSHAGFRSQIVSSGLSLYAYGVNINGLTLNNAYLVVQSPANITQFDNVTFSNYSAAAVPLTISSLGLSSAYTFHNVNFLVTPSTGSYIQATDTNTSDGNVFTVNMVNSYPADGSSKTATSGAVVNWNLASSGSIPGTILYSRSGSAIGTIWMAAGDGSSDSQIAFGEWPALSPDKHWMAYHGIYGSGSSVPQSSIFVRQLPAGADAAVFNWYGDFANYYSFTADSSHLIFDQVADIDSYALDGSGTTALVSNGDNGYDDSPVVRLSDGAFAYHVLNPSAGGIGIANADGSNRNLVANTAYPDAWPQWSPDETWLSFTNNGNVFKIHPDGSSRTQLTYLTVPGDGFLYTAPWSPDGKYVVSAGTVNGVNGLYGIATDGSGTTFAIPTTADAPIEFVGGVIPAARNVADVAVTASVSPASAVSGSVITYSFQVANNGPGIAKNTVLTATMSPDLSLSDTSGASCSVNGQVITCSLGDMAAPTSGPVTASVNIFAYSAQAANESITATVNYDGTDPSPVVATLNATQSFPTYVASYAAGSIVALSSSGTTCVAAGQICTYSDGSLSQPVTFTSDLFWNTGSTGYPTTYGGDGTNHYYLGGGNYDANSGQFSVAGSASTDTTDPATIRYGSVVGSALASPSSRSDYFNIGKASAMQIGSTPQDLYLVVNDCAGCYGDNTGAYTVTARQDQLAADPDNTNNAATGTATFTPALAVAVSPTSVTVNPGNTQQFTATVSYSSNTAVTWTLSGCEVGCGTIDSTGLYTAPSTIPYPNTVIVIATSQADGTTWASAQVTIAMPQPALGTVPYSILYSRGTANGSTNGTVNIAAGDGSSDVFVTSGEFPRMSPDHNYIVFHRDNSTFSRANTYVRNVGAGTEQMVFANGDYQVLYSFSNDSSTIFFDYSCQLNTMTVGGIVSQTPFSAVDCYDDDPTVNPATGTLAFHNVNVGIGVMDANGANRTFIPNTLPNDILPAWSPDGQWIAFLRNGNSPNNWWKIHPDGTGLTRLTFLTSTSDTFLPDPQNTGAAWTPDGASLIVAATIGGVNGLFAVSPSGSGSMIQIPTASGTTVGFVGAVFTPQVSVVVAPSTRTIAAGTSTALLAFVNGSGNTAVSWSTTAGSITATGVFTAPATAGSATITATSVADPSKSASAIVNFTQNAVAIQGWGANDSGQLGNGTTNPTGTPSQVSNVSGVTQIATGSSTSLAVKTDGTLWGWGYNFYGALGTGTNSSIVTIPVQVNGLSGVVAAAAGCYHTLALKGDGTVWALGYNGYGEVGNGTTNTSSVPTQVTGLSGVVAIAAGCYHSVALKSDGTVWVWGYGGNGEAGNGSTGINLTPVQSNVSGIVAIASGAYHVVALKADGSVWNFGYNGDGQIGDGTTNLALWPYEVNLSGVVAIAGATYHTLAVKSDGTVWAWGENYYGELGNTPTQSGCECISTPVQVNNLSGAVSVAGGYESSMALKADGSVWSWGYNGNGQFGDGTTTNSSTPVQLPSFSALQIASGNYFEIATVAVAPAAVDHLAVVPSTSTPSSGSPFGVTVIAQDASNNTVTSYTGTVHFTITNADTGAVLPADYTFGATDAGTHSFTNGVTLTAAGAQTITATDTGTTHYTGTASVSVAAVSDLSISGGATSTVRAGSSLTYTYTVANAGPSAATSISLVDTVPAGATVTSVTAGPFTCATPASTLTCTLPSLAYGATAALSFTVDATSGTMTNVASVYSSVASDPNGANNSVTTNTIVQAIADVAVTNVFSSAGGTETYSLTVTDAGPSSASSVVAKITLDRFTAMSYPGTCTYAAPTLTCTVGALALNASTTIAVVVNAPRGGWASISAYASGVEYDPNPVNNAADLTPTAEIYNTGAGSNVIASVADSLGSATVNFAQVTAPGNTSLKTLALSSQPPAGYRPGLNAVYYDLSTTAAFNGSMNVSFRFSATDFHHPRRVRLFHMENGAWVDRTTGIDAVAGMVSATTTSLSPFAIFEPLNAVPVANSGTDVALSGKTTSGSTVPLDGSASSDADGDTLTYRWTGPFPEGGGTVTGAKPTVTLPFGTSRLALVVNDGESDSAAASLNVTVADFTVAAAQPAATVAAGAAASYTLAVSPKFAAFDAAVALSCGNVPAGMTCSFSPATVTPGANGATSTLTVTTNGTAANRHQPFGWLAITFAPFGFVLVGAIERKLLRNAVIVALLVLLIVSVDCGGGGLATSSAPSPTHSAATSTVTVTATSAGVAHSTTVTLTVQ